ncbi:MAG TPA: hypothetical protein PK539_03380 [Candidatus Paceibacterota bacterium]|nr:hypothetical protein [Candidatus Paceibacterota bacterium]
MNTSKANYAVFWGSKLFWVGLLLGILTGLPILVSLSGVPFSTLPTVFVDFLALIGPYILLSLFWGVIALLYFYLIARSSIASKKSVLWVAAATTSLPFAVLTAFFTSNLIFFGGHASSDSLNIMYPLAGFLGGYTVLRGFSVFVPHMRFYDTASILAASTFIPFFFFTLSGSQNPTVDMYVTWQTTILLMLGNVLYKTTRGTIIAP